MATITSRDNPSFSLFPVNRNVTNWRPFSTPTLLIVPHSRDANGLPIQNAGVNHVSVAIENVAQESLVAGADHIGLLVPDHKLHEIDLTLADVASRKIDLVPLQFIDQNGQFIGFAQAKSGDTFQYRTTSGVADTLTFYPDADYYDLSDVLIPTEDLPSNHYILVYSCQFFVRVLATGVSTSQQDLLCIDATETGIAALRFDLNHPGEVIDEFNRLTPAAYLTDAHRSQDTTLSLYRPFTTVLQDIYDEQKLLESLNWVFKIPFEGIPYLSQLLGWDMPYFPQSLDNLRRAVLRETTYFQQLKGSRRAIRQLMKLFGFTILINNLWWSEDGTTFIGPGDQLPSGLADQAISFETRCQIDPILAAYNTSGFGGPTGQGGLTIPLLFRPQVIDGTPPFTAQSDSANVTIDAYLVQGGGPAAAALDDLVAQMAADPANFGTKTGCVTDINGFNNPVAVHDALANLQTLGHSQLLINQGVAVDQTLSGQRPPLTTKGVAFDPETNYLSVTFDSYLDFSDGSLLYAFATYSREEIVVPTALLNLQSNRFRIQILDNASGESVAPDVVNFVVDFIFRLKAFHSLLEAIVYDLQLTEGYCVTDNCAGGDITQRFDTGIGQQQVPPAIIPKLPGESCQSHTPQAIGYKPADIQYRLDVLGALVNEFIAYQFLDGRLAICGTGLRIAPAAPVDRASCQYTPQGQDRVISPPEDVNGSGYAPSPNAGDNSLASDSNRRLSPVAASACGQFYPTGIGSNSNNDSASYASYLAIANQLRQVLCNLDGKTDYCYKGRPDDALLYMLDLISTERSRRIPCVLGYGSGLYYSFPAPSRVAIRGVDAPAPHSLTPKIAFSGHTPAFGLLGYLMDGRQANYLTVEPTKPLPLQSQSWLGRLYRAYGQPTQESLHFTGEPYLGPRSGSPDQSHNLAIQRPEIDIQKPNLHFPGCRFPAQNRLVSTFTSPDWRAKPWDEQPAPPCCIEPLTQPLNAHLDYKTNGDEVLIFDDEPFIIVGNGLEPDISSYSDQVPPSFFTATAVVHKVYMVTPTGHPAIELDAELCLSIDPLITTGQPLFPSATQVATNQYLDIRGGYPCVVGYQPGINLDLSRGGKWFDLLQALEVPGAGDEFGTGTSGYDYLFTYGSGILVGQGLRYDCGCVISDGGTMTALTDITWDKREGSQLPCEAELFVDQDGKFDFDCDHLVVHPALVEDEELGAQSYRWDSSIPSFFELVTK